MSTGSRLQCDIFVSYAHADDEPANNRPDEFGWVTTLVQKLKAIPGHYPKTLFMDRRLKPGDAFSDDLLTTVENSTFLLLLLSPSYIKSAWCGKELDHFIRTHANDPDKPDDVFVVELTPFEDLIDVPGNIQNIRRRLIHAHFWDQSADGASSYTLGYPSPEGSDLKYWRKVQALSKAIDSRLLVLRRDKSSTSVLVPMADTSIAIQERNLKSVLGPVLLARTTRDLVQLRSAVKATLESEGVVVLPEGDYVNLTPEEFEKQFAEDLKKSQLFVQLLSPTVSDRNKNEGFTAPSPQLQFHRANAAKLPIMQWCERLPGKEEIRDAGHARLFNTEYLRTTNRTAFEREVLERLREIKQVAEVARAAVPTQPMPVPAKKLIFVDDVAGQKDLNEKLCTWLQNANCNVRRLPPQARLDNSDIDIAQVLKLCRAGIVVFAKRTARFTVYNRLARFQNQIAEFRLPLNRWAIYVTSDTVECDLGLILDNVIIINTEQQLLDFIGGLQR